MDTWKLVKNYLNFIILSLYKKRNSWSVNQMISVVLRSTDDDDSKSVSLSSVRWVVWSIYSVFYSNSYTFEILRNLTSGDKSQAVVEMFSRCSCEKGDAEPACPLKLILCSVPTLGQTDKTEVGQWRSVNVGDMDDKKEVIGHQNVWTISNLLQMFKVALNLIFPNLIFNDIICNICTLKCLKMTFAIYFVEYFQCPKCFQQC